MSVVWFGWFRALDKEVKPVGLSWPGTVASGTGSKGYLAREHTRVTNANGFFENENKMIKRKRELDNLLQ